MKNTTLKLAMAVAVLSAGMVGGANAANHREAPITTLDPKADISDWHAFHSYGDAGAGKFTFILNVDPLLIPGHGPNWFPFDHELYYAHKIDNDFDSIEDISYVWRFSNSGGNTGAPNSNANFGFPASADVRLPNLFTGAFGLGTQGVAPPTNQPSPAYTYPQSAGKIIQPAITSVVSIANSEHQVYNVFRVTGRVNTTNAGALCGGTPCDPLNVTQVATNVPVVPTNVGGRTTPGYGQFALSLSDTTTAIGGNRIFAGTVDESFPVALGQVFDSLNLPGNCGAGVNLPQVEASQGQLGNCAPNETDGLNVNILAIELPLAELVTQRKLSGALFVPNRVTPTFEGNVRPIGTWGTTSRRKGKLFGPDGTTATFSGRLQQIARMGQPLYNELVVGTGFKNKFSMQFPDEDKIRVAESNALGVNNAWNDIVDHQDNQIFPRIVQALRSIGSFGNIALPELLLPGGVRRDFRVLTRYANFAQYMCREKLDSSTPPYDPLICQLPSVPGELPAGDGIVANNGSYTMTSDTDLLRLDLNVEATPQMSRQRLGPMDNLTGNSVNTADLAGHPNGRRVSDDVVDTFMRIQVGVLAPGFDTAPNNLIGDGTQGNDFMYQFQPHNPPNSYGPEGYQEQFPYHAWAQDGSNSRQTDPGEFLLGGIGAYGGCPLAPFGLCPPSPGP